MIQEYDELAGKDDQSCSLEKESDLDAKNNAKALRFLPNFILSKRLLRC